MRLQDAIARLERAGNETSKATQKLYAAADALAAKIEDICPEYAKLPRGYRVVGVRSNVGYARYLEAPSSSYVDSNGGYLHGDFSCELPSRSRKAVLQFAQDVAEGWLTEVSEWLEERGRNDEERAQTLERALSES